MTKKHYKKGRKIYNVEENPTKKSADANLKAKPKTRQGNEFGSGRGKI